MIEITENLTCGVGHLIERAWLPYPSGEKRSNRLTDTVNLQKRLGLEGRKCGESDCCIGGRREKEITVRTQTPKSV